MLDLNVNLQNSNFTSRDLLFVLQFAASVYSPYLSIRSSLILALNGLMISMSPKIREYLQRRRRSVELFDQ